MSTNPRKDIWLACPLPPKFTSYKQKYLAEVPPLRPLTMGTTTAREQQQQRHDDTGAAAAKIDPLGADYQSILGGLLL